MPDDKTQILIDTSPDFREQMLAADVSHLDAVLFSHDHADQTHGIDDVRALVIANRKQIKCYMDQETHTTLFEKFRYCFDGSGGYPPILALQPLIGPGEPLQLTGEGPSVTVLPVRQKHGRIVSLGFRFGPVAYCNDVDAFPESTAAALTGLDLLVIDALRYTPHPSHFHLEKTLEWIARLNPKQAVLTNLHVDMDYQTLVKTLPSNVEVGFDGWAADFELI